MSKIQDLIDLKLMHPTGEEIYECESSDNDYSLLKEGINVILRNASDDDKDFFEWYGTERSVTIAYGSSLYKSHSARGSYGREEWTEWREVKAIPVIRYDYVESPD